MPRYPDVHVRVADGKQLEIIVGRALAAMKHAGINTATRCEFRAGVPRQYALAVAYIREWCDTD